MLSLASCPENPAEFMADVAAVLERLAPRPANWGADELMCAPVWGTPRNYDRPTIGPAVELAVAGAGIRFMPWQRYVADVMGELDPVTGRLVYRETVLLVPRQQGKTTLIFGEALHRCLGWGARQYVAYTAQTRLNARHKWEDEHLFTVLNSPVLGPVLGDNYTTGQGSERMTWPNDSIWSIESVQEDSGHGSTLDLGIIDEAFAQVDDRVEQAMKPAQVTRADAQLLIASTAGTPQKSPYLYGKVESGRARVEAGQNRGRAYFEWTAAERRPDGSVSIDVDHDDPATARRTMPALGYTITEETVETDRGGMKADEYARAYLNLWLDRKAQTSPISSALWAQCLDELSQLVGRPMFSVDMTPDRSWTAIGVAGQSTTAGKDHLELTELAPGSDWVVDVLDAMARTAKARRQVVIDSGGPAATLIPALERAHWKVWALNTGQVIGACGDIHDSVRDGTVAHIGQVQLDTAVAGAGKSKVQDRWRFNRGASETNIAPLMVVTMALYGHRVLAPEYSIASTYL